MSSNDNRFRNRSQGVTASATVKYAGGAANAKASFLRPADTALYAPADLVADKTVAAQVAPLAFVVAREFASSGFVTKARLFKSNPDLSNAAFRLHLFGEQPTPAGGDNAPFVSNKGAAYLGSFTFPSPAAFSDGAWTAAVPDQDGSIAVDIPGVDGAGNPLRTIWGLLQVLAQYQPASSERFEITLELQQD